MDKTTAAIIVSYQYYLANPNVRAFLEHRKDRASMVAFVEDADQYDPENSPYDLEWNVVITNSPGWSAEVFKVSALSAISKHSNLYPAIAIDPDNMDIYDEAGCLIVLGAGQFG
jgi:hypothetical protein